MKSNFKQARSACGIGTQRQREGCFLFRQVIFRPAVFCLLCFLSNTADCTATCCPQRHTTASFGLSDIAYVSFFVILLPSFEFMLRCNYLNLLRFLCCITTKSILTGLIKITFLSKKFLEAHMTASIVSFHNVLWSWHLASRSHFVILALHSWTHWQSSFDKCATMRAASHLYDFYPLRFVAGTACQSVHETLFTDKLLLPKESQTTRFLRSSTQKLKGMWVNAKLNGKVLLNVALLFEKKLVREQLLS